MYELLKMNITEDIAMFCRVCLQLPSETEMLDLNLIYDEEEQLTYSDCFTMCTKINICEDENLPQNLCRSCGLELQMAYDFHRKVEESKRLLIQLQEQQQTESTAVVTEVDIGGINGSQESNQEVVVEEEEHLDMEEYQAEEHLDEEDLDYKIELCIKEETMEEQMQTEALVDGNNLMTEKDYKECTLPSNTDDNPTQIAEIKTEFVQQLSESESEIEEDFTFDDLYEKVFEDIKNEQLEEGNQKLATKVRVKRRRRGRPPLNRRSESEDDDSDLIFGGIELSLEGRQNEGNKNHNSESDATEKLMPEVSEFGHESDLNLTMSHAKPKRPRAHRTISSEQQGPPFVCEVCNLPCKSRALLNSHRFRKHRPQDAAQFNCPKCDRAFNNQQSLQRHLRRPTCEAYPQFDCEHCGKKCIGLSNYKIHLRFHKRQYPFVCHLCGKKFMMCVHLNEHVLVKHENKRYPCEHPGCGKLFQTRNSLYNHAYQHKGFMPYECEYCRRGYASKSRLRFHCKKSHNINHTIEELDRMQVTEKLPNRIVKAQ